MLICVKCDNAWPTAKRGLSSGNVNLLNISGCLYKNIKNKQNHDFENSHYIKVASICVKCDNVRPLAK